MNATHPSTSRLLEGIEPWLPWLTVLGIVSTFLFFLSLLIIPILILRLPTDAFCNISCQHRLSSPQQWLKRIALQMIGFILLLAGIAMLVLPGQGILTILVALSLLRFPGRQKCMRAFITTPTVWTSINWIRARAGLSGFQHPSQNAEKPSG